MADLTEDEFCRYVAHELSRIIEELPNWPGIAQSLAEHLHGVVSAWPNVMVHRDVFDQVIGGGAS